MNQKKILLSIILVFILLLGGAYALYTLLGQSLAPDQLAVQKPPQQDAAADATETAKAEQTAPEQAMAPDFIVYDIDGNEVRLSDYVGKPIVLNFWASWCGPCQMEMPDFHEKYLELSEDVHFLMINMTDGSRETVHDASQFIAEKGYTFPVFYDTQSHAAATYGVFSLPSTYFIDAEGHAIARATGAIDAATLQRGIDMIA